MNHPAQSTEAEAGDDQPVGNELSPQCDHAFMINISHELTRAVSEFIDVRVPFVHLGHGEASQSMGVSSEASIPGALRNSWPRKMKKPGPLPAGGSCPSMRRKVARAHARSGDCGI